MMKNNIILNFEYVESQCMWKWMYSERQIILLQVSVSFEQWPLTCSRIYRSIIRSITLDRFRL